METQLLTDFGSYEFEWEVPKREYDILKKMPGLINEGDFKTLAMFACVVSNMFPRSVIVDIGTYCGKSAFTLALVGKLKVFSIDRHNGKRDGKPDKTPTFSVAKKYRHILGLDGKVSLLTGDSASIPWGDKNIGLMFVDGGHTYNEVLADYEHFKPFLLPGAFVLFHDYRNRLHPEVKSAVDSITTLKNVYMMGHVWAGRFNGTLP